jgi:DNA-binding NarL/FixJ family response regulator
MLIADDHPIVRMEIEGLMAHYPELELIGEAMTGDEAIRLCVELQPDVLVLDMNIPGLKAVKVVRQLQQCQLPTRVLVMASYSDAGIVKAMLQAGATGYLL